MEKAERTFTLFLEDEKQLDYPDFDAMWSRIVQNMPPSGAKLAPVDMSAPKRKRFRKLILIAPLTAVIVASPVIAAISYNWEHILSYGVQSALEQGLGQSIEKSVTIDGVTMTIHTAVVDENRTVLLYNLSAKGETTRSLHFFKMELKDAGGRTIEGRQSLDWDKDSKTFKGYFEAEWTPDGLVADVQLTASGLQFFSPEEREIALYPFLDTMQTFDIQRDEITKLTVRPFIQGEKIMLDTGVMFNRQDAIKWASPKFSAFKNGELVKEVEGILGKPGEHGEYTGKLYYQIRDLKDPSVKYKLFYTREVRRVDKDWTISLHLDKKQMLSGTIKRTMNVPVEFPEGRMTLNQMVATPTQIRLKVNHEKYMSIPYLNFALDVNGTILNRGMILAGDYSDPESTTYRFELSPGIKVAEQTPITFVAKYEVLEHKDATEPIHLTNISRQKQSMSTKVGGYSVLWTYYMQDGSLYVQSECADLNFGGISQTYMISGGNRFIGKQVTTNLVGDGNNRAIDEYPEFTETEADIHIFRYYTESPDKEIRVPLFGQGK